MNSQCAAIALDRPHPFASLRDSRGRARSSTGQSIGLRIRGLGVRLPSGAPMKLHRGATLSAPVHASLFVWAVLAGLLSGRFSLGSVFLASVFPGSILPVASSCSDLAAESSYCTGRVIWLMWGRTR